MSSPSNGLNLSPPRAYPQTTFFPAPFRLSSSSSSSKPKYNQLNDSQPSSSSSFSSSGALRAGSTVPRGRGSSKQQSQRPQQPFVSDLQPSPASLGLSPAHHHPSSSPTLSTEQDPEEESETDILFRERHASSLRLLSTWESIAQRYKDARLSDDDEVCMKSGRIVKDRGHLSGLSKRRGTMTGKRGGGGIIEVGRLLYDEEEEEEEEGEEEGQEVEEEVDSDDSDMDPLASWGGPSAHMPIQNEPIKLETLQQQQQQQNQQPSSSSSKLSYPSRGKIKPKSKTETKIHLKTLAEQRTKTWGSDMDADLQAFLRAEEARRRARSMDGSDSEDEDDEDEVHGYTDPEEDDREWDNTSDSSLDDDDDNDDDGDDEEEEQESARKAERRTIHSAQSFFIDLTGKGEEESEDEMEGLYRMRVEEDEDLGLGGEVRGLGSIKQEAEVKVEKKAEVEEARVDIAVERDDEGLRAEEDPAKAKDKGKSRETSPVIGCSKANLRVYKRKTDKSQIISRGKGSMPLKEEDVDMEGGSQSETDSIGPIPPGRRRLSGMQIPTLSTFTPATATAFANRRSPLSSSPLATPTKSRQRTITSTPTSSSPSAKRIPTITQTTPSLTPRLARISLLEPSQGPTSSNPIMSPLSLIERAITVDTDHSGIAPYSTSSSATLASAIINFGSGSVGQSISHRATSSEQDLAIRRNSPLSLEANKAREKMRIAEQDVRLLSENKRLGEDSARASAMAVDELFKRMGMGVGLENEMIEDILEGPSETTKSGRMMRRLGAMRISPTPSQEGSSPPPKGKTGRESSPDYIPPKNISITPSSPLKRKRRLAATPRTCPERRMEAIVLIGPSRIRLRPRKILPQDLYDEDDVFGPEPAWTKTDEEEESVVTPYRIPPLKRARRMSCPTAAIKRSTRKKPSPVKPSRPAALPATPPSADPLSSPDRKPTPCYKCLNMGRVNNMYNCNGSESHTRKSTGKRQKVEKDVVLGREVVVVSDDELDLLVSPVKVEKPWAPMGLPGSGSSPRRTRDGQDNGKLSPATSPKQTPQKRQRANKEADPNSPKAERPSSKRVKTEPLDDSRATPSKAKRSIPRQSRAEAIVADSEDELDMIVSPVPKDDLARSTDNGQLHPSMASPSKFSTLVSKRCPRCVRASRQKVSLVCKGRAHASLCDHAQPDDQWTPQIFEIKKDPDELPVRSRNLAIESPTPLKRCRHCEKAGRKDEMFSCRGSLAEKWCAVDGRGDRRFKVKREDESASRWETRGWQGDAAPMTV